MRNNKGKDNAESLFYIKEIPCDNQIRNLLDPVPASKIFGTFKEVYEWLEREGIIKKFLYLEQQILIALDGTEYFSSKKINCPHCNVRHHRNGTTTYFHGCVTPLVQHGGNKQTIKSYEKLIAG